MLFLWVINHSWERATGSIKTNINIKKVSDLESGESIKFNRIIPFNLEKKQVRVYKIEIKGEKN